MPVPTPEDLPYPGIELTSPALAGATREALTLSLSLSLSLSAAAAAAKSFQLCPTLCNPIDGSPPGSPVPWDSPGQNTGVGCHFLLQCRKVKSESEVTQLCPTLSDCMDYSLPGSSVHGIFEARVLEWGAIAFSRYIYIYIIDCTLIRNKKMYTNICP